MAPKTQVGTPGLGGLALGEAVHIGLEELPGQFLSLGRRHLLETHL